VHGWGEDREVENLQAQALVDNRVWEQIFPVLGVSPCIGAPRAEDRVFDSSRVGSAAGLTLVPRLPYR
jgi:hypothetical protein